MLGVGSCMFFGLKAAALGEDISQSVILLEGLVVFFLRLESLEEDGLCIFEALLGESIWITPWLRLLMLA